MFELKNYSVFLKDKKIIDHINLSMNGNKVAIVGANGAGKSSLALSIVSYPSYRFEGEIILDNENITNFPTHEKSKKGIFLSLQKPVAINGLSCLSFFKEITKKDAVTLIQESKIIAEKLELPFSFLQKSLNAEFSGGEQKKLELMQLLLLKPKMIILDEIDSGLDIAIKKTVASVLNEYIKEHKAELLIISHQPDFLELIGVDTTYTLKDGLLC